MGSRARQHRVTEADYLAGERHADVRHEYVEGVLFALAGASRAHNAISTNLAVALGIGLRGTGCRVASSDMKVKLAEGRRYYYPDLVVSCTHARDEPDDYTETHPVLLVEILSDSTEQTDRREKLLAYQSMPSVVDYLILSQTERAGERFTRDDRGWTRTVSGPDEDVELASIGLSLPVEDIYVGVPLGGGTRLETGR